MRRSDADCYVAVFSKGRSANVANMQAIVGDCTWYVPVGEGQAYADAGATSVVESGGLCRSRNQAIDDAHALGLTCVQMSDDLKTLQRATTNRNADALPLAFVEAVAMLTEGMEMLGAKLAGAAPTANAFYFDPNRPIHQRAFIVGDLIAIAPCDLRFDENLRLKEDYDYTLQHLSAFGVVARRNDLLASFVHRSNPGGAVAYRTPDREQEAIAYLRAKWGAHIKNNARRPNEILLAL